MYEIIIDCGLNCKKEVLYAWFAFLTRYVSFSNDGVSYVELPWGTWVKVVVEKEEKTGKKRCFHNFSTI